MTKTYKIYKHPSGDVEAVKQGWSWPAFFFAFFWGYSKKLWMVSNVLLVTSFVMWMMTIFYRDNGGATFLLNIILLGVSVLCGMFGNGWRVVNLPIRGYEHLGDATGTNPDGALADFIKAMPPKTL